MKAYGKFIAAKQVTVEKQTATGIYLAETSSDKVFEVVSIGSEVKEFSVGDKLILGPSYQGEKVKVDSEEYFFFNSEIVLGVY